MFANLFLLLKNKNIFLHIFVCEIIYISFAISREFNQAITFLDIADYKPYLDSFVRHYEANNLIEYLSPHVPFYTLLYPGWLYLLDGEKSYLAIRIINVAVSILCIMPLNGICRRVFCKGINYWQVYLILLWLPYTFRLGVEIGRTPLSLLTIITSLYFILCKESKCYLLLGFFIGIYSVALRIPHILFYLPLVVYQILESVNRLDKLIRIVLKPLCVIVAVGVTIQFFNIFNHYSSKARQFSNIEDVAEYAEQREAGSSAYLTNYSPTLFNLPVYIPLHGFYFNYSPMPWDAFRSLKMLPSSIFSMFSLLLLILFFRKNRFLIKKSKPLRQILISLAFSCLVFGMVTKNAGSAERWRMPITLLSVAIFSYSLRGLEKSTSDPFQQFWTLR